MCNNKVCIKNKGSYIDGEKGFSNFSGLIHKESFYVPCGHCLACQQRKQLSWQFRLRQEMDYCKSCGGYVFKEELTYRDKDVPRLEDTEFMCFSREHIKVFLKKLRVYMKRYNENSPSIKYFVCCEYGPNGTHRPHYHILLFVYGKFDYAVFNRLVQKAWIYGYTNQNKGRRAKNNWSIKEKIVNSYNGVEYVTKYLFKDYDYFHGLLQQEKSAPILEFVRYKLFDPFMSLYDVKRNLLTNYDTYSYKLWSLLYHSTFKSLLPFMQCSKGIGCHAPITFDDAVKGIFNDITSSRLIPVCDYYKRKLLYDYISMTKSYVPSFAYKQAIRQQQLIMLAQSETQNMYPDLSIYRKFNELPLPSSFNDETYTKLYNRFGDFLKLNGDRFVSWHYLIYNIIGKHYCLASGDYRQVLYDLLEIHYQYDIYFSFLLRLRFNLKDAYLYSDIRDFFISIDSSPQELEDSISMYMRNYSDPSQVSIFFEFEQLCRIAEEHISKEKSNKIAENLRANMFNYLN